MDIHKVTPDPELLARAEAERVHYPDSMVRPFVVELVNRGRVRAEEWSIPMNNYERDLLLKHLETEVFLQHYEHCLKNCSRREGISYDDAVINDLSPEAIRRMREIGAALIIRERHWQDVDRKVEVLSSKLREIGAEARRVMRLLTDVINWCQEGPEDEKRSPFRKDTYVEGVRHAKSMILKVVLGRLEPTVLVEREEVSDG